MTETGKYRVMDVISRMLEHMWVQDRRQYMRITLYPFLAVLLPKIAIGILEQESLRW